MLRIFLKGSSFSCHCEPRKDIRLECLSTKRGEAIEAFPQSQIHQQTNQLRSQRCQSLSPKLSPHLAPCRADFVMDTERATTQDIRPLEILLCNLMPTKIETENQILSLLANSPLQVRITLLATQSYIGKTPPISPR